MSSLDLESYIKYDFYIDNDLLISSFWIKKNSQTERIQSFVLQKIEDIC